MRISNIDFSNVSKRKSAINSTCYGENPSNMYRIARESLKENKSTVNRDLENFFNACRNIKYANNHYNNCLFLIESITSNEMKNRLVSIFSEEIIPYVKNLNSLKESVKFSNIDINTKSVILNSIKENKICDRILSNDKMLKKRFDIENYIVDHKYQPLENIVFECCSLLDTYDNIPSYGKMNIALEELSYYLQKQAIKYDKSRFVELVTEYFLYRNNNIDKQTKTRYINVLKENIMISNNDLSNVKYFVEPEEHVDYYDIKKIIYNFNNNECKDLGELKSQLQNIFEKSPKSVVDHYNYLLETLRHLIIIGTYNFDNIQDILRYIPTRAMEIKLDNKYTDRIINIYRMELEIVEKQMNIISGDKYMMLQNYHNCIADCVAKMEDYFYKNSDYECRMINKKLKDTINGKPNTPTVSLQEFKIFKFDNLIKASMKIDKFLKKKSTKITASIQDRAKKIFKATKDFFNESDILNLGIITEDNSIDICIAIIESKENEIQNMNSLMEALCIDIENRILFNEKDLSVYYTNIGDTFELHLEQNVYINLTEEQEEIKNNSLSERDLFYINRLHTMTECLENISKIDSSNIISSCYSLIENNNIEYLESVIEALSYTDIVSKRNIVNLKESYSDIYPDHYHNNSILGSVIENYWSDKGYEVPLEAQTEALLLVQDILNEAEKKNNIKNTTNNKKVDIKKPNIDREEKRSISIDEKINNMKLAMAGVKKKAKDLSAKEQELSRNLDATVSMMYRSMKQAVISDRREAIIKGSVVPNFSKFIKIAIALIGIGYFTQPIYAVITALVGLAASRNLTRKERSLLLDEIDIELKVVDKELQMAENSGNTKKYRKLLTFQKKLQREKARIRYGSKVGRDLPDNPTNDY